MTPGRQRENEMIQNQESCEDLADRRAAAVRDLLVSEFGVPEAQLVTAGLGYEKDPFVRGRDVDANGIPDFNCFCLGDLSRRDSVRFPFSPVILKSNKPLDIIG